MRLGNGNAAILADYLLAYKRESDTKDSTRATNCLNMILFAEKINKPLRDTTREDVLHYFDGLRKRQGKDRLGLRRYGCVDEADSTGLGARLKAA